MDESFTIALINHSPWDLIKTDALDVHPPLSYLIFKALAWPISHFTNYINLEIIYLRLWNVAFGILSIFFLSKIIKLYQKQINYYMLSAFIILSQIVMNGLTLRMYQIATLFLILELYNLLKYIKVRQQRYLWFTLLFASLSAYSHYFAAIFAGLILFYYWLTFCFQKDRDLIIKLPLLALCFVITNLPWMTVAIKQISSVKKKYWISPVESWNAVFQQSFDLNLLPMYTYLLIGLLLLQIIFWWFHHDHPFALISFVTLLSYLTAYLIGVIEILNNRPILIDRYLYPMFSITLFFTLMSLSELKITSYLKYPIYLAIIGCALYTIPSQVSQLSKFSPITSANLFTKSIVGSEVITPNNYSTTVNVLNLAAKNPRFIYWIPLNNYTFGTKLVQTPQLFKAVYPNIKPY
ncbi:glycosyltransferase family protein [Periweissella fabalis]|uniref:Glycosyltransferase family 39 protein n=1 Tax=Periweissella fabalis TaxID=1070421 RepID=A0A7X6N339_9LACO|nr:glycosyltransferase family 39 protein [Periweissella fabalis]MCM0599450.1 glycosyltransferase family 39 protein [Periweissella fabalis]NKZ23729.1 glycosyltransferase family 39 protein [Periweissella fabalis]